MDRAFSDPTTLSIASSSRISSDRSRSVPPTVKSSGTPHSALTQNHINPTDSHLTVSPLAHPIPAVDIVAHLHRSGAAVVKTRTGSVLSRGCILKTDNFPSGRALDLDLSVQGAPNFRAPRSCQGDHALNVYGVAQPRMQGLKAILSILRCRPGMQHPTRVVWFSTREEPVSKCLLKTISACLPALYAPPISLFKIRAHDDVLSIHTRSPFCSSRFIRAAQDACSF
jgi:hypothetical protein